MNVPASPEEWARWGFAHRDHHLLIRDAIQLRSGINLSSYDLDPIPFDNIEVWLERNQLAHNDMNNTLNLQGSSLQEVDLSNHEQAVAWVYLHLQEHTIAGARLGI